MKLRVTVSSANETKGYSVLSQWNRVPCSGRSHSKRGASLQWNSPGIPHLGLLLENTLVFLQILKAPLFIRRRGWTEGWVQRRPMDTWPALNTYLGRIPLKDAWRLSHPVSNTWKPLTQWTGQWTVYWEIKSNYLHTHSIPPSLSFRHTTKLLV